jgi:CHAT domain-containing protein
LEPPTLRAEDLAGLPLPAGTAAVALTLTAGEAHALLLHAGTIQAVPLPDFTTDKVRALVGELPAQVEGWVDAYNARGDAARALREAQEANAKDVSAEESRLAAAQQDWRAALDEIATTAGEYQAGWFFAYLLYFHAVRDEDHRNAVLAADAAWKATVARIVDTLAQQFWAPLAGALPSDVRHVLLVPAGLAALLPLHAAAPAHLSVAYAPSLGVWQQCHDRATGRHIEGDHKGRPYLFLATPADDLFFTLAEADWLVERCQALGRPVTLLPRPRATAEAVRNGAAGHRIVHFSGHAGFNWNEPARSALACRDKNDPLTLLEIRRAMDLSAARLVTLSACETGVSDVFASGEEFVGLPAGLLEAGAPAVVASLWPVADVSTAFLMDRFYELWLGHEHELTIAEALQAAAGWLRNATRTELLARIAASNLPPEDKASVERALEKAIAQEATRMAAGVGPAAAAEVARKPEYQPFAAPYYWAPFAAYGAVL